MSLSKVAYRYAMAFYEEADDKKDGVDKLLADMNILSDTLGRHSDLFKFLTDPSLASYNKFEILSEIFKRRVSESTLSLIRFLSHKRRLYLLKEISEQVKRIYLHESGVIKIKVTLSPGLGVDFGKKIVDQVSKNTGYRFEAEIITDEELQGGFVYIYDGKVYDYSIKGGLNAMEKSLNTVTP